MLLAFDIGGTNTRLGVSPDGATISASTTFATDPHNYDNMLRTFVDEAKKLAGDAPITGVAGGLPGFLTDNKSTVRVTSNLPGWHGKPLGKDLSKAFNAPVFLDNDTAIIGLGEAVFGAGKDHNVVVYLSVSTGVGGCRTVDGSIDTATFGFEPGHQTVVVDGRECACGGKGHLESYIGGAAMQKLYGQKPEDIHDPKIWDEAAMYLAAGLNNLLMVWSPEVFVLGGALMNAISIEKTTKHFHQMVTLFDTFPPLLPAIMKDQAGFLGALAILKARGIQA